VLNQHLAEAEKDGFTLGLKLVRGAYILSDNRSLIHDTKQETGDAYNNRASVITAQRMHQQRVNAGFPTVPVAFGQLHGMSDEVSFSLLQEKDEAQTLPDVFKCSIWGSMGDCVGYLLRRAVENRGAVLRTSDEISALRKEVGRRLRAFISI